MANSGSGWVGSKFVSVNLNKSYGRPQQGSSYSSSSHGAAGSSGGSRFRSSGHGGMVVLSRPRSGGVGGAKAGPKLSVPPPLNLPSLRKEHERFDSAASGGSGGTGPAGSGSGHASSGIGWTKPGFLDKEGGGGSHQDGGAANQGSMYMPPAARAGPAVTSPQVMPPVDKVVVLRGEDFPSLQAALPATATGLIQKQRDGSKPKNKVSDSSSLMEKTELSVSGPSLHMRPQLRSSCLTSDHNSEENAGSNNGVSCGLAVSEQVRKQDELFPGPLPLVRLSHRSDWADDERDTGNNSLNRDRDQRYPRGDRDFDIPKAGYPNSYGHNFSDVRGKLDAENGMALSRVDPFGRDVRIPSREGRDGNTWRTSLLKDGVRLQELSERNDAGSRPFSSIRDNNVRFGDTSHREGAREGYGATPNAIQDSRYTRGQTGSRWADGYSGRGGEQNSFGGRKFDPSSRYKDGIFQKSSIPKSSFSMGSKGISVNDPLLNFGKEKLLSANSDAKPYVEDAFGSSDYDKTDLFPGNILYKKKKDMQKQVEFHDPVRESFEAELERVQQMQERERQRVAEEQARALEMARKEEEERQRLAREEEEIRRRLEEEAREAAWRAEQERLEALKQAEEQRIAREEEKRRILMEDERRKEAARQKLLELEARMARRQVEFSNNNKVEAKILKREIQKTEDIGDWEDNEQMVERITNSASFDSFGNRLYESGSRLYNSSDGATSFLDKGKHTSSWKRDVAESGSSPSFPVHDHENGFRSLRPDPFGGEKAFQRKEFYGAAGVMSSRKTGPSESHGMEFSQMRVQRWNLPMETDHYSRNADIDSEFSESQMDRFGDMGWGQGRSRSMPHSPNGERFYQNPEADGFSSFGRSRHSMRQPRVLPPPSLVPMHRNSFRTHSDHSGSAKFLDGGVRVPVGTPSEREGQSDYGSGYQEKQRRVEQYGMLAAPTDEGLAHQINPLVKNTPRCDSQSSLSVSSPPDSPTHLSHDEMDDSGESSKALAADDNGHLPIIDNKSVASTSVGGPKNLMTASNIASSGEDEEWSIENNQDLQHQDEYDEEDDEYKVDHDVHEGEDENIDLVQEFEGLPSEELSETGKKDNLVLGFDEGVEMELVSGDEYENLSTNVENATGRQREPNSFDSLIRDSGKVEDDASSCGGLETSTKLVDETGQSLRNLVINATTASETLNGVEVTTRQGHQSSPKPMTSSLSVQPLLTVSSTVPSASMQNEAPPVNLQFGLFSGPSLIPSPVPAIQIGSIQMPLPLPHQMGSSLAQIHHSQPSFFQFGQLRYTSPISQGILPLASQPMSVIQPSVQAHHSCNQANGGKVVNQELQDFSTQSHCSKDKKSPALTDNNSGTGLTSFDLSHEKMDKEVNVFSMTDNGRTKFPSSHPAVGEAALGENKTGPHSLSLVDGKVQQERPLKSSSRFGNSGDTQVQPPHFLSSERSFVGSRAPGTATIGKGKRLVYTVKNSNSKSLLPSPTDASRVDLNGFPKRARRNYRNTEFRVRESMDKSQLGELVLSEGSGLNEKSCSNGSDWGTSMRSGSKKDGSASKAIRLDAESNLAAGSLISRNTEKNRINKTVGREAFTKRQIAAGERKSNSNAAVEDVEPLSQSGIVRVFKQPGIEAPSDEDDFIEVRSKRQMLNDRREQREKEIKSKTRTVKAPRKPSSAPQASAVISSSNRVPISSGSEVATGLNSEVNMKEGHGPGHPNVPTVTTTLSPPLPPIGTPTVHTDGHSDTKCFNKKSQPAGAAPILPADVPGLPFDAKNVVLDEGPTSLAPWVSSPISQQLMNLTLTQLDEAMKPKPLQFNSHVSYVGDPSTMVSDSVKPSSSISSQDSKSFLSASSPLNSLLAGETIQFGAVTSPTILPPSSCTVSNEIGPTGSCRVDVSMDQNISASEANHTIFFKKNKQAESCVPLDDPEAEAEAAASAVAVAAISNDDVVGNQLSISASDTKSFETADLETLPSEGVAGKQSLLHQRRSEESLPVALPADLSVETPSLSLWPPLPSPQSSSNALLSHFPGAPTFPYYEMNPMLGGPIFAFGPQDEPTSNQQQSQKSSTTTSPLGAWQQYHSGVDSFYGPPNAFAGPFISAPGGIPGVQGPPHMVVYNHFAPVGQFGQVGLSFMGTTYIPSGKQPDWKHTPGSSAMTISESEVNNADAVPGQRNPPNMPGSIQHLAPGSPLLPMPSPLALFDMSPFQSTMDMSMQARWPQVTAPPIQSVPLSMPLQQPAEGSLPLQFSHGFPVDPSTGKKFQELQPSTSVDGSGKFPLSTDSVSRFPDDLGLLDSSSRPASHSSVNNSGQRPQGSTKSSSRSSFASGESGNVASNNNNTGSLSNSCASSNASNQYVALPAKAATLSHQKTRSVGYPEQRGSGMLEKVNSGGEWNRSVGYQGRNQNSGTDKNFSGPSKVKQIYVAKQSVTSGSSTMTG